MSLSVKLQSVPTPEKVEELSPTIYNYLLQAPTVEPTTEDEKYTHLYASYLRNYLAQSGPEDDPLDETRMEDLAAVMRATMVTVEDGVTASLAPHVNNVMYLLLNIPQEIYNPTTRRLSVVMKSIDTNLPTVFDNVITAGQTAGKVAGMTGTILKGPDMLYKSWVQVGNIARSVKSTLGDIINLATVPSPHTDILGEGRFRYLARRAGEGLGRRAQLQTLTNALANNYALLIGSAMMAGGIYTTRQLVGWSIAVDGEEAGRGYEKIAVQTGDTYMRNPKDEPQFLMPFIEPHSPQLVYSFDNPMNYDINNWYNPLLSGNTTSIEAMIEKVKQETAGNIKHYEIKSNEDPSDIIKNNYNVGTVIKAATDKSKLIPSKKDRDKLKEGDIIFIRKNGTGDDVCVVEVVKKAENSPRNYKIKKIIRPEATGGTTNPNTVTTAAATTGTAKKGGAAVDPTQPATKEEQLEAEKQKKFTKQYMDVDEETKKKRTKIINELKEIIKDAEKIMGDLETKIKKHIDELKKKDIPLEDREELEGLIIKKQAEIKAQKGLIDETENQIQQVATGRAKGGYAKKRKDRAQLLLEAQQELTRYMKEAERQIAYNKKVANTRAVLEGPKKQIQAEWEIYLKELEKTPKKNRPQFIKEFIKRMRAVMEAVETEAQGKDIDEYLKNEFINDIKNLMKQIERADELKTPEQLKESIINDAIGLGNYIRGDDAEDPNKRMENIYKSLNSYAKLHLKNYTKWVDFRESNYILRNTGKYGAGYKIYNNGNNAAFSYGL